MAISLQILDSQEFESHKKSAKHIDNQCFALKKTDFHIFVKPL